ncbi:SDR family oxidoreductase [Metabacillus sp. GX 13764]|uniref:SDR family oxidoreductase n=1 Tax=Metabacillus kandeliae TaxID=2900151 RepID=UPI001E5B68F0|nr:SDR family NAD(P)-dependent oxidoreductase [Metabacillus kandeliae]MCD7036193.1 SDR family oxidoreductase [Metabacillus kandeliae]
MTASSKGKVAIVTGGGSGIGKASALLFAKEGMKVWIFDLDEENASKTKAEIEQAGGKAMVTKVDMADEQAVEKNIKEVGSKWGKIDVVFSNAGINGVFSAIEELDPDDWDKTITTNLKGTFLAVKHSIPFLKKNGGSIIITSSINGNRTFSNIGMSAYATSKAGQTAFMKMAALELAQFKIRVNAICPGFIETNIESNTERDESLDEVEIKVEYPEGGDLPLEDGPGTPEQVANLVYFLASDESSHVTGTEIYVDGAESLLR